MFKLKRSFVVFIILALLSADLAFSEERDDVEARTSDIVRLGASNYGSTSWPVRLFNPITAFDSKNNKPILLWSTDAIGDNISDYKIDFTKMGKYVYRRFELVDGKIRCLEDHTSANSLNDVKVHTEMESLGVRKSFPTSQNKIEKLLGRYGLHKGTPSSDWYNMLRGLPLEEMGMSTNLLIDNVPNVSGQKMYRLDLEQFLKNHPFGKDEPLVADWDYGPMELQENCKSNKSKKGSAIEMCVEYGGPPARDPYHVDFKLNPLWILEHKQWPRFGSPDGNWYKDTLDQKLKETSDLWELVE